MNKEVLRKVQLVELDILKDFDRVCKKHDLKYSLAFGTAIGAMRHNGFIPWDDDIDVMMPIEDYIKFGKEAYKDLDKTMFFQNNITDKNYYLYWNKIRKKNTVSMMKEYSMIDINYGICIDIFPCFKYPQDKRIAKSNQKNIKLSIACLETVLYKYGKKKNCSIKTKIFYKVLSIFPRSLTNKLSNYFLNRVIKYNGPYEDYIDYSEIFRREIVIPKNSFVKSKKIQFEDSKLCIINNADDYLKKLYGNYMKLPPKNERKAHGDLIIRFEENMDEKQ